MSGEIINLSIRADLTNGGASRISSTVSRLGLLGRYRVVLLDRKSMMPIREVWSDSDGNYSFDMIKQSQQGYIAVALDHTESPVNAAISDLLTPGPMP